MTRLPELEQELVAAAVRLRNPRRRLGRPVRLVLAAAAVAVAVALVIVTVGGTEDREPARFGADDGASPEEPPRAPSLRVKPVPGTLSPRLAFEAEGRTYSAQAFRARNGTVCVTLSDLTRPSARAGGACLRERLLRDELPSRPAVPFAAGGTIAGGLSHTGFARADVVELIPRDPEHQVVLSRPWAPHAGRAPIRFFYVFTAGPLPEPGQRPRVELSARLRGGRTVEVRD